MFWTQVSFQIVFQGDLWWKPRWHVYLLVYDFSSFHPNSFRNTISWKCFVKNDCVRSSLIELQPFPQSKIDVDPIHCVFMFLLCVMQVLGTTWYTQVNRIRILMLFVSRIYSTPYTAIWCFFHFFWWYHARRGTLQSIVSGSLWFLSMGSTDVKNTVCLLLKCWPPGINPDDRI